MIVKKSKKANLENKRTIFFELGIIVALSFVLLAFEWTTVRSEKLEWDSFGGTPIDEDMAVITVQKEKKIIMPKPVIPIAIIITDGDIDVDDPPEIDAGVTGDTENDPYFEIPKEDDEVPDEPAIFLIVEENPSFPGGMGAFYKYLNDNINYPPGAMEAGIEGPVYMEFIVWKDGSIRMANVKRGIGAGCDEEALRVIKNMPKWNPGKQRSVPVNVRLNIPIKFELN